MQHTSTQRQQVNPRHLQEIHLLALRAGIANACPVSKSAKPKVAGVLCKFF